MMSILKKAIRALNDVTVKIFLAVLYIVAGGLSWLLRFFFLSRGGMQDSYWISDDERTDATEQHYSPF